MRKIVIDMQNYLFADAVATSFKNSDYDTTTLWICCGSCWTSVSRMSASRWPTSAISTAS